MGNRTNNIINPIKNWVHNGPTWFFHTVWENIRDEIMWRVHMMECRNNK